MTVASTGRQRHGAGAAPLVLNSALFDQRMRILGHTGEVAKAEAAGVDRRTLLRLRRGQTHISLALALKIADRTGIPLGDLFLRRTA